MAILLEPDRYTSVLPLFESMTNHLAVVTVLAGIVPGRIYVDDPASPRSAILLPSNPHRVYVSGEPAPHILTDVLDSFDKHSLEAGYGFVVYFDTSHPWKPSLEQALEQLDVTSSWRQLYRLQAPGPSVAPPLPERITIGLIDETLIADVSLANRDLLVQEIQSESPSLEHFFQQNFGFYAQDQDSHRLVAWCLAEYHFQGRYELGIETLEGYQRQGIATHLADAVIRRAFAEGATEIGWHCWAANTPSVAAAVKLGFEKVLDYPVYFCQFRQPAT
jgi:GNAT superfamily N-acetyltransferase